MPKRLPRRSEDGHLWETYAKKCDEIDNDPVIREAQDKWRNLPIDKKGRKALTEPVSPIINAKLQAWSDIMLGRMVTDMFMEKLLGKL